MFELPSADRIRDIQVAFTKDLESYTLQRKCPSTGAQIFQPVVCCVCDGIPTTENWYDFVRVDAVKRYLTACNMTKDHIADEYRAITEEEQNSLNKSSNATSDVGPSSATPGVENDGAHENTEPTCKTLPAIVSAYTADHEDLTDYVLSPRACFDEEKKKILVCKSCMKEFGYKTRLDNPPMPSQAIANNFLVGEAPAIMKDLNEVETGLLSWGRAYCQTWTLFGGCHQQIKGWHTILKNRVQQNVGAMNQIADTAFKGNILVVLCGPFTTTQLALTMKKTTVNPTKVIAVLEWLKENNYWYRDFKLPTADEMPAPVPIYDETFVQVDDSDNGNDVDIENRLQITCVFPDATRPAPTNGGFASQKDFRDWVAKNNDGTWNTQFHARPSSDRMCDYKGDELSKAFPLLFPYGFSGLEGDLSLLRRRKKQAAAGASQPEKSKNPGQSGAPEQRKKKNRISPFRPLVDILRKFLRHSRPEFHTPVFNLVVENTILKDIVFRNTRMHCTIKISDTTALARLYGEMTVDQFSSAINNVKLNLPQQYSAKPQDRFLRSVRATCGNLPHTNEATKSARKVYFSYLIQFGTPAIFFTITPNDQNNFRIVLYAIPHTEMKGFGEYQPGAFREKDILATYNLRSECRTKFPGLCAEEYGRIIRLVIKHFLQWDAEAGKSTGTGLFSDVVAWLLATEEQGRKTLHGHFLIFIKNWKSVLECLQTRQEVTIPSAPPSMLTWRKAKDETKELHNFVCSAQLFADFHNNRPLSDHYIFHHEHNAREKRDHDGHPRYPINEVDAQQLREMRNKKTCDQHAGVVAKCGRCDHKFDVNTLIQKALNAHLGHDGDNFFAFPESDEKVKKLDHLLYEFQKDYAWYARDTKSQCLRYFCINAAVNAHLVKHCKRCFKKGNDCFANLPDEPLDELTMQYNPNTDSWSDWCGRKSRRTMFSFRNKRNVGDNYMNTHNPYIAQVLPANNNVMLCMTGPIVIYVTGYNVKPQQKEEAEAYEKVSQAIFRRLKKAEDEEDIMIPAEIQGFRSLLTAVYANTGAHIMAAPMAHHLAVHGSRFRYSHEWSYMPNLRLRTELLDMPMIMNVRKSGNKNCFFHRGMDYTFRNTGLEKVCLYDMVMNYMSCSKTYAKKKMYRDQPQYEFLKEHPLERTEILLCRSEPRVPVLEWTWLPSTQQFITPITDTSYTVQHDPQFHLKEEYCLRFMILFLPFRTMGDLKLDGSHLLRLREAIANHEIAESMQAIADNIQDLHNSMAATVPVNQINAITHIKNDMEDSDRDNDNLQPYEEDILNNIVEQLGDPGTANENCPRLDKEPTELDPVYASTPLTKHIQGLPKETDGVETTSRVFGEVFRYETSVEKKVDATQDKTYRTRHKVSVSQLASLYCISNIQDAGMETNSNSGHTKKKVFVRPDGTWESIILWGVNAGLDDEQQVAFEILAATYVLTFYEEATETEKATSEEQTDFLAQFDTLNTLARTRANNSTGSKDQKSPLRLFITGPAGAGKSKILNELRRYCKLFTASLQLPFDEYTIRVTAITGAAATEIEGVTTASATKYMRDSDCATDEDIKSFESTRLIIIDEISFINYETIAKVARNLKNFTEAIGCVYGNRAIAFLGDFCQLEAIGGTCLYDAGSSTLYWEQALTHLVELKGTHRYSECTIMQEIMPMLRDGKDSQSVRDILNTRVVDGENVLLPDPMDVQYATYHNAYRAQINANVFKTYLENNHRHCDQYTIPKSAIVIKCEATWKRTNKAFTFAERKVLFENCSENECVTSRQRCDPMLCLFHGCRLMNLENDDVENGIANGTTTTLEKVVLKKNARSLRPMKLHGYWVYSVSADDVDHLLLRFHGLPMQGTFKQYGVTKSYSVRYPVVAYGNRMYIQENCRLTQFPLILNHATTGHKLQGKTVDKLVIAEWSTVKNWAYVVLSRVKSLAGLYLLAPIPVDINFEPSLAYKDMMNRLRNNILAPAVQDLKQSIADKIQQLRKNM